MGKDSLSHGLHVMSGILMSMSNKPFSKNYVDSGSERSEDSSIGTLRCLGVVWELLLR